MSCSAHVALVVIVVVTLMIIWSKFYRQVPRIDPTSPLSFMLFFRIYKLQCEKNPVTRSDTVRLETT